MQVAFDKRSALNEKVNRQWMLSVATFLRNQNCSMADAVLMWKANVDQQFAGVEACMICYTVIHPTNRSLPRMRCRTCQQNFHNICLYKWFRSSSKSNCPHCQSPW
jgi:E3 ubiquitin-protein ligase listerin